MQPQNDLLNIRLPHLLKFHLPKSFSSPSKKIDTRNSDSWKDVMTDPLIEKLNEKPKELAAEQAKYESTINELALRTGTIGSEEAHL